MIYTQDLNVGANSIMIIPNKIIPKKLNQILMWIWYATWPSNLLLLYYNDLINNSCHGSVLVKE